MAAQSGIVWSTTPSARLYARAVKPHLLELAAALNTAELGAEGLTVKPFALE